MERKLEVEETKNGVCVTLKYGTSGRFIEFTLKEVEELRRKLVEILK